MSLAETALAILLLLVTPGPTNTLLALAGAERGLRRALALVPVELLSYLATVLPLALAGIWVLDRVPQARGAITVVAALWVLWLARSLWRLPAAGPAGSAVTARRVAVTTLLNPKALLFGLVLLPATDGSRLGANVALFATLVVGVAVLWAALGALLRQEGGLSAAWRRGAALWLGALGLWLAGQAAGIA